MSRQENIETDTRTRILDTTWKLLETDPGRSLSMSAIAKASSVSRQALYLHFASRSELLIATTRYVDKVKGLDQRLAKIKSAKSGSEMLHLYIKTWGNYIPEIYSVSKALMMTKDHDQAAADAWSEIMGCLRDICDKVVQILQSEGKLSSAWKKKHATDFLWTIISIQNWEHLTQTCGWNQKQYVAYTEKALMTALVSD